MLLNNKIKKIQEISMHVSPPHMFFFSHVAAKKKSCFLITVKIKRRNSIYRSLDIIECDIFFSFVIFTL